ncbi:helicase-associated [Magnetococcus marinus MC-1]|uniref:Helicase-associated n=1 Tax=Magnetococcus marinus (strain ATCC BAA-1437 / JCM 17883 / MC-1) TaxID=156889 RepID=A0L820_MAGMM|nr:helicase associated domain-containing protein [Magnetococcus marinus]ABK44113.1 helicase-associated [Magnetococcus marinus MC-1]
MGNIIPSRLITLVEHGLFDNLHTFSELEARFGAVEDITLRHEWMACLLHGLLATGRLLRMTGFQLWRDLPEHLREQMGLHHNSDNPFQAIYKSPEGGLHAVGALFSENRAPITPKLLAPFAEAQPATLRRVLITNANALPNKVMGQAPWFAVRGHDLDQLTHADFVALRQWLRSGRSEPQRHQPAPALVALAKESLQGLQANRRRTVVLPPSGLTESLLLTYLEGLQAPATVTVAVSGGLARLGKLWRHLNRHASSLSLSVFPFQPEASLRGSSDRPKLNPWELPFALYDEPAAVERFSQWRFHGIKLYLTTPEGLPKLEALLQGNLPILRMITDAHKLAGKRQSRYPYLFEELGDFEPARQEPPTLFLTHAPEPKQAGRLSPEGDPKPLYSMESGQFGPQVMPLEYRAAVERQLARPYQLHLPLIFMPTPTDGLSREEHLSSAQWRGIKSVLNRLRPHRVLSTHVSSSAAQQFYTLPGRQEPDALREGYVVRCFDGKWAAHKRESQWNTLQADPPMLLAHSSCLTKGETCPPVDALLLVPQLEDKLDLLDALQPLLRPTLTGGTPTAHIILPLVFHRGFDAHGRVAGEPFGLSDLQSLLMALKGMDSRLEACLHEIRLRQGMTGTLDIAPLWQSIEVTGHGVDGADFKARFGATLVEALGGQWECMLGAFASQAKRLPPQTPFSTEDDALDSWVKRQRKAQELGALPKARHQALSAVGFDWDPDETQWQLMYRHLSEFKQQHGHDDVPEPWQAQPELPGWVRKQRRDGFIDKLADRHRAQLEALHFVWDLKLAQWQEMFEQLRSFKQNYGHDRVPEGPPGNSRLHRWCSDQRKLYGAGKLEPDQVMQLEQLHFVWDLEEQDWQIMLAKLKDFLDLFPGQEPDAEQQQELYSWSDSQRKLHQKQKLAEHRWRALQRIGFDWDPALTHWWRMLDQAIAYQREHGHIYLDKEDATQPQLAQWLFEQRKLGNKQSLPPDQFAALSAVGMQWDQKQHDWHAMRVALVEYHRQRRHCHVPKGWSENPALAKWVVAQRSARKKEQLSAEQVAQLDELGFIWDAQELYWEQMFIQLVEFHTLFGHCNVPDDYEADSELAWWVEAQRKSFKASSLGEERGQRLDELGFVWDPQRLIWESSYEALKAFHAREGHSTIPINDAQQPTLARWVQQQRAAGNKNLLSPELMALLDELDFIWEIKQAQAEELFQALRQFKQQHGHCDVPVAWAGNAQLGLWVQFQRQTYQDGKMDQKRFDRLNELGFRW